MVISNNNSTILNFCNIFLQCGILLNETEEEKEEESLIDNKKNINARNSNRTFSLPQRNLLPLLTSTS
jgi:hypothetical protein